MSQTLSSLFAPRKLPSLVHANEPDHSDDCHGDLLGAIYGTLCLVVFVLLIHGASHGSLHSARSSRSGWSTLHIFDLRSGDNCGDRIPNLECESEHSKVFQRGPELSSTLDDCNDCNAIRCRLSIVEYTIVEPTVAEQSLQSKWRSHVKAGKELSESEWRAKRMESQANEHSLVKSTLYKLSYYANNRTQSASQSCMPNNRPDPVSSGGSSLADDQIQWPNY